MLRTLLAAAALVTTVGVAPAVVAQGTRPGAEPRPVPRYQVEVIIFAYRDFDPTEERFEPPPPRTVSRGIVMRERPVFDDSSFEPLLPDPNAPLPADPSAPLPLPGAEPTPEPSPPTEPDEGGFRALRSDELQLSTEYRKIGNVPTYLPLVHTGWIQPGLPEEQAEPIDLARLGAPNPMGSIRVHLGNFLHVRVDLSYQDELHTSAAQPGGGLNELAIAPRYDLRADRITRSGDLLYIDHPAFGVLVKITPVPASTSTSPAPAGTRPAA